MGNEVTEKSNLALWDRVKETDPRYTKKVSQRGGYTSISPQYQLREATDEFGPYGSAWGLRNINFDYTLFEVTRLVVLKAEFYYPDGSFEISNAEEAISAKGITDSDFAKKLETNTLSKALSKLGFSADVFMGEFDDVEYLEHRKAESAIEHAENKDAEKAKQKEEFTAEVTALVEQMKESVSVSMLNGLRTSALRKCELRNAKNMMLKIENIYNEIKEKLESK